MPDPNVTYFQLWVHDNADEGQPSLDESDVLAAISRQAELRNVPVHRIEVERG